MLIRREQRGRAPRFCSDRCRQQVSSDLRRLEGDRQDLLSLDSSDLTHREERTVPARSTRMARVGIPTVPQVEPLIRGCGGGRRRRELDDLTFLRMLASSLSVSMPTAARARTRIAARTLARVVWDQRDKPERRSATVGRPTQRGSSVIRPAALVRSPRRGPRRSPYRPRQP